MDDPSIRELLPPLREPVAITAAGIKEEEVPRSGIPTLTPLGIVDSRSEIGGGHIDYSAPWTQSSTFFLADFHIYLRYVIGIGLIIYTLQEEAPVHQLCRRLVRDGAARVVGVMKRTLDPDGILSPDKHSHRSNLSAGFFPNHQSNIGTTRKNLDHSSGWTIQPSNLLNIARNGDENSYYQHLPTFFYPKYLGHPKPYPVQVFRLTNDPD
ncbi:hypothetical protein CNMCM6936_003203 [Aspergillus lentulus]|nr:hypothetical protein CNMCM6069_000715 [Aspergillus lentulus]KAF4161461.1 hypothetical protein CNMCM6936_003203 [Aspergillus lentulus]KAF4173415.1 hypothetical protein CNMCM8060_000135 [Aspergillus lentulus]KAF4186625.1 hypothetical protein CNMCM7927_005309 [Aspergillus lentulus]KAF4194252.1 hypothetical protein CNMCM8694_007840 [Aspergillus lentulus]